IVGHDAYARRQIVAHLDQLLLDPVDHRARVLPDQHHHHAGHGFALTVAGYRALAHARREGDLAEVAHVHRHAVVTADHDVLDVGQAADQARAADDLLLAAVNQVAAAGARVVALERAEDVVEPEPVGDQRARPELDLVGLQLAAVAVDLDHAGHRLERGRDLP